MSEEANGSGEAKGFSRDDLRRQSAHYLVAPGLLSDLREQSAGPLAPTIVELNVEYPNGLLAARNRALSELKAVGVDDERLKIARESPSRHNLFVDLTLTELVALTERSACTRPFPIYKIWRDEELHPLTVFHSASVRTIKADACLTTFRSEGEHIVVAVADSGIDGAHLHFRKHRNLVLPTGIEHRDYTGGDAKGEGTLTDVFGHGTHVAGIVAGECSAQAGEVAVLSKWHDAGRVDKGGELSAIQERAEHNDQPVSFQGVAPKAKLLNLKVLDAEGKGRVSRLLSALEYLFELNDSGRKLKVHCLNLSLGYPFDAEWYAAGQSPLCVMVNRLVRSGMVVVAAAGNDGSVRLRSEGAAATKRFGLDQSINDPGNAQEAITVGSTHADSPHMYGVSYFSSRGPTADGRLKPDLLAPGERIISCLSREAARAALCKIDGQEEEARVTYFREESGTSMAAPHVTGAAAAFLSIQREFIGRPEAVKKIFMDSCTDLGRAREFQGAGLIDLMRAVQSV